MQDPGQDPRHHVFAVNGSPEILSAMRDLLEEEGHRITTSTFESDPFAQIAARPPDVLVVDVAVGEQGGWDLLERLHATAATAAIPVLVTSTSPRLLERARAQADRLGAHRRLVKPFRLETLLTAIRALLGAP